MSQLEIVAMRPFVPAKDFETSLRFYTEIGFDCYRLGDKLASMHLVPFAFLLQDYYLKDWAEKFMMHVLVKDLQAWRDHIVFLDISKHYDVSAPAKPQLQSWGLVVSYIWDPAGVLWHFAQEPALKGPEPREGR